jgi:undecaprenyl pyrophosphate synthase
MGARISVGGSPMASATCVPEEMTRHARKDNVITQTIPRLPRHVGFIPDGNRRWAVEKGLAKQDGYAFGIAPGLALLEACLRLELEEVSVYGFTQDNTRRPSVQKDSFSQACVDFALEIARHNTALLVLGDDTSAHFPPALKPFRVRQGNGMKVNFLVNYGWEWDLDGLKEGELRSHARGLKTAMSGEAAPVRQAVARFRSLRLNRIRAASRSAGAPACLCSFAR